MSDFDDDDPTEGAGAGPADPDDLDDRPSGATGRSRRNPRDEDDWDDDPAPREPRRRPPARQAVEDDWDDDDWDDDDGRGGGGRRDLTLVIAIAGAVAVIALVVILTRPKDNNSSSSTTTPGATTTSARGGFCDGWPGALGGDGSNVSKGEGVYIWSGIVKGKDNGKGSSNGIHIRNNGTDPVEVKVDTAYVANPAKPSTDTDPTFTVTNKGTATASAASGKEVTFTLPAGKGTDGPDLAVPCGATTMAFDVTAGGSAIPATQIKVGGSAKAEANPANFTRGAP